MKITKIIEEYIDNKIFISNFLGFSISFILASLILLKLFIKGEVMFYNHPHFPLPWDHHKYIFMALTNPFDFHIAPYCWRVFVPFIASFLPFTLSVNFLFISFISIVITGYFIYKISLIYFDKIEYGISALFFYYSLNFAVNYILYDFWLVDAFAILLIVISLYAILIKNDFIVGLTLIIGALTKESVLFVVPLYYSLNSDKIWNMQLFFRTLIISLPALIVFVIIRILIPQMNDNSEYLSNLSEILTVVYNGKSNFNYLTVFYEIGVVRIKNFNISLLEEITIMSFGMLIFWPFLSLKESSRLFIKYAPFLCLTYLQIFFAVNTSRLIVIAFPLFVIASLKGIRKMIIKLKLDRFLLIIFSFIAFMIFYFHERLSFGPHTLWQVLFSLIIILFLIIKKNLQKNKIFDEPH